MAGGFGAGRGGKKKIFDDRAGAARGQNDKETRANQQRHERLLAHISYLPRERYPISYPVSPAPTLREQAIIARWKYDQKAIRAGKLFVRRVVDSGPGTTRVSKGVDGGWAGGGGFGALRTWSARYERRYRVRPEVREKLWLKPFLPEELWDTIDPSLRKAGTVKKELPSPTTNSAPKTRFNINDFSDGEGEGEGRDPDEDQDDSDAEREAEAAEEVDDDFEEMESDNDDYNGERYFDDGERDDDVGADAEYGDDLGGGDVGEEREFGMNEEFDV